MQEINQFSDDVTRYEKLVQFQGNMMESLYDEPLSIFRLVSKYMACPQVAFLVCDIRGMVQEFWYDAGKDTVTEVHHLLNAALGKLFRNEKVKYLLEKGIPEGIKAHARQWGVEKFFAVSVFNGVVHGSMYTAIMYHDKTPDVVPGLEKLLINNIQVCLENRIYHEMVAYESQHDMLTKLFNRRSYYMRSQEEYPSLNSIGVIYFDVNNLKKINDCYGHDAGDALIQKAAESIRCLTSDTVHGYRMGGDEFIVVAMNCTQSGLDALLVRWGEELQKVNEKYGGEPCVIAVGSAFAEGSFEIEEVCQLADKRMYRDKHLKKKAVGQ